MRTVLLRDDDTNALTPVECLETLYRPFLDRGLPVNLAVIPEVRTDALTPEGAREGFLPARPGNDAETVPLAANAELVRYLQDNPGFHVAQHGCHHDACEFGSVHRADLVRRLDRGRMRLREAGINPVGTFVAPHDRFSRVAYEEVARRFRVISTGWFEWRRLPYAWRPRYLWKKLTAQAHWRVGRTQLLSHPGCLLSHRRPIDSMLERVREAVRRPGITVLVTHWWEYFSEGRADTAFIRVLHQTAELLAADPGIAVVPFDALVGSRPKTTPSKTGLPAPAGVAVR